MTNVFNRPSLQPCTCPACILGPHSGDAPEVPTDEDDDPIDDDIERQISENTGSYLDAADEFDVSYASDPRSRRPVKNQSSKAAASKPKPGQKFHHREVVRDCALWGCVPG